MRKFLISIAAFCCLSLLPSLKAAGQGIAPKFGVEWGLGNSAYKQYHVNYLTEEGMRVDDGGYELKSNFNGELFASAGVYLGSRFSADLMAGYAGVADYRGMWPVLARGAWYTKGWKEDTPFVYLAAGPGFALNTTALMVRGAYGYRLRLSPSYSLNASLVLQGVHDSPDHVIDRYSGVAITKERLRFSSATYCSILVDISFYF